MDQQNQGATLLRDPAGQGRRSALQHADCSWGSGSRWSSGSLATGSSSWTQEQGWAERGASIRCHTQRQHPTRDSSTHWVKDEETTGLANATDCRSCSNKSQQAGRQPRQREPQWLNRVWVQAPLSHEQGGLGADAGHRSQDHLHAQHLLLPSS